MIEVDLGALGGWQAGQVFVIRVVLEVGDAIRANTLQDLLGDGGLAGAGTAGDADHEGRIMRHDGRIIPVTSKRDRQDAGINTSHSI